MANHPKAYIVGGGIAGLATAAYLIRDGGFLGENITILDASPTMNGGSLDEEKLKNGLVGYVARGHRFLEEKTYACTFDLFSFIPSLEDSEKSVTDTIFEFNKKVKSYEKGRLVEDEKIIDGHLFELDFRHKFDFLRMFLRSEKSLGTLRINDFFKPSFFETNLWYEGSTIFAFQPWHSLVEFRRYMIRFFHVIPLTETLTCTLFTPYHQFDSMILPLLKWLKEKKVHFKTACLVYDLDFIKTEDQKITDRILYVQNEKEKQIKLSAEDLVFVTNGSMTIGSQTGAMDKKPEAREDQTQNGWCLWNNLAQKSLTFGRPEVFNNRIDESQWESFSITFRDSLFFDLMEKKTGDENGTGVATTLKSSNWILSVTLPHQPHFRNQSDGLSVCWGYGLLTEKEGNYIKKKMSDCTGEEILRELCYHLGFEKDMEEIVKSAICIPCLLPYTTSQFLTRSVGDRPEVIPKKTKNLAFIGQFCEQKGDIVFTDEYSVRSAQKAVFSLLNLKKKESPLYRGYRNPMVIYRLLKAIFNFGK